MTKYEILENIIKDERFLEQSQIIGQWNEVDHKHVLEVVSKHWDDFLYWPRFKVV